MAHGLAQAGWRTVFMGKYHLTEGLLPEGFLPSGTGGFNDTRIAFGSLHYKALWDTAAYGDPPSIPRASFSALEHKGCATSGTVRWQARGPGTAPVLASLDVPCGPLASRAYATDALTSAALRALGAGGQAVDDAPSSTVPQQRHGPPPVDDAPASTMPQQRREGPPIFLVLSFPDPHPEHATRQPYASMHHAIGAQRPAAYSDPTPVVSAVKDLIGTANCSSQITPWTYNKEVVTLHEWAERFYAKMRRAYAGMVSLLDDAIGRLVRGLRVLGTLEDTLIVLTSDHGDLMGGHRAMFIRSVLGQQHEP